MFTQLEDEMINGQSKKLQGSKNAFSSDKDMAHFCMLDQAFNMTEEETKQSMNNGEDTLKVLLGHTNKRIREYVDIIQG